MAFNLRFFNRKYTFLFVFLWSVLVHSQQYPVDVQTFVTPPYPQNLRGYWDTFEAKIQTHLLLKDLSSPVRNVTLRFSLENLQGQVVAQTASYALPFQTQLTPGVRKTLSKLDFKSLFALENLSGISEHFYNDLLPEGTYFFCFTAYDMTTQSPLSNKSRAMVQIRRYTPPLLTLPARGEIISKRSNFQHIVFQWLVRDPAPFVQYEFTLKEVWDNSLNADEAFISGRLVYQGKVPSNTILYGNDKPFLLENKRYAWRVRAFTNNPNNPNQTVSYFRNNGESETFFFDYVSNCEAPKFLMATAQANTAEIRWQGGGGGGEPPRANIYSNGNRYKILYREKGKSWKSQTSNHPQATLTGLKRGRNYVYKVGIACGLGQQTQSVFNEQTYLYSTEQEFTTTDRLNDSLSVQCGVKPEIRIKNSEPLQEVLGVNETFTAGDFPVTVISATGSNGVFSGVGYVQVPYLLDTKIKVTFDGITLNTERQLIAGKLVTTYDKLEKNIFEIPIIGTVENAIETLKNIFREQKRITKEQEKLDKQLAENKIDNKKYKKENENLNKQREQNNKNLDAVNTFAEKSPAIPTSDKENIKNKINSFKFSSGSKQSFDENKAKELVAAFEEYKEKENLKIAEIQQFLVDFSTNDNSNQHCDEWIEQKGAIGIYQFDYVRIKHCDYGTMFELDNGLYVFRTDRDIHKKTNSIPITEWLPTRYYLYNKDLETNSKLEKWQEFTPENRKFIRDPMPEEMRNFLLTVVDYVVPVESGYILVTGKNFEGEERSRLMVGVSLVVETGLTFTVVGKGFYKIGKGALKAGTKTLKAVENGREIVGKVANLSNFQKLEDLKLLFSNKNLSKMESDLRKNGWKKLEGNWGSKLFLKKILEKINITLFGNLKI